MDQLLGLEQHGSLAPLVAAPVYCRRRQPGCLEDHAISTASVKAFYARNSSIERKLVYPVETPVGQQKLALFSSAEARGHF